jgi:sugar phosphate permease
VQNTSLLLLVLIGAINYIDRATLAIANPLIREELGLSVADMRLLLSAFLGAFALAQLPASEPHLWQRARTRTPRDRKAALISNG